MDKVYFGTLAFVFLLAVLGTILIGNRITYVHRTCLECGWPSSTHALSSSPYCIRLKDGSSEAMPLHYVVADCEGH